MGARRQHHRLGPGRVGAQAEVPSDLVEVADGEVAVDVAVDGVGEAECTRVGEGDDLAKPEGVLRGVPQRYESERGRGSGSGDRRPR